MEHSLIGWKKCPNCAYRTNGKPERDTNNLELIDTTEPITQLEDYLDEMMDRLFQRYGDTED